MVSNPITSSLQKFASQNIAHGIKENLPLNRIHFSGPSGGYQQQHVYHDYGGGQGHGHGHGHSSHGGGKKRSIALSALTLLAFLYFLNILQNCIEDQMEETNPQIIVMASRLNSHFREDENRQETSKSGSSESGSIEERHDIDKKVFEEDNFQRIDNYFNSTLNRNKKHKKGKL